MGLRMHVAALVREFKWGTGDGVDLVERDGFFKTMHTPLRAPHIPTCCKSISRHTPTDGSCQSTSDEWVATPLDSVV
uniref:Uncharacterized protein n=1 Tax=Oryza brachyantha TaxID=4533 RepID=J3LB97_ORYBR